MKLKRVILRWYKSFNVNYIGYEDRRTEAESRPWNNIDADKIGAGIGELNFIEIPIENDITTIIGANESGKSHLLSAISKVVLGHGLNCEKEYRKSDLCFYSSRKNINSVEWPQIGLEFTLDNDIEMRQLLKAADNENYTFESLDVLSATLLLAPNSDGERKALIYINKNENPIHLSAETLEAVRSILPKVRFIDANLAISDQIPLANLILAYGSEVTGNINIAEHNIAQEITNFFETNLNLRENASVSKEIISEVDSLKRKIKSSRKKFSEGGALEALLFKDVLGINVNTLKDLLELGRDNRGYCEGIVSEWNRTIDERLNLSHYWQQDEFFKLEVDYKEGILHFVITDKTGAKYTFSDRSSGLKYFLSYYIQARAMELSDRNRECILLMDEPDSFLSSVGQKNLLEIFESLVGFEESEGTCQIVYATHSPFLINRNFPRRIRLLRKGDSEEGSQHIRYAMVRRFEPVRSALGIDCAHTLFMGSTNIVLEGPTDQYLLSELIRIFSTPNSISELLDLNRVTLVSAETSSAIIKLLSSSVWADEPLQSTIVLLDADEGGENIRKKITGFGGKRPLISKEYVMLLNEGFKDGEFANNATIEDIIPIGVFTNAVSNYYTKWHKELTDENVTLLVTNFKKQYEISKSLIPALKESLKTSNFLEIYDLDKMGICYAVIDIIRDLDTTDSEMQKIYTNLKIICSGLRRRIDDSHLSQRKSSFSHNVKRVIGEFFNQRHRTASFSDINQLIKRLELESEAALFETEKYDEIITRLKNLVTRLQADGDTHVSPDIWKNWFDLFQLIKRNPALPVIEENNYSLLYTPEEPEPNASTEILTS